MSSTALSQNEIDRLLDQSAGAAPRQPEAQRYDFRRPHRVAGDKLRTLEAIYEQLVKTLEGWLIGRVRGHVELRLESVEQFSFAEFILSLPTPCSSFLLDIRGYNGQLGMIDFGQELSAFLVDRLFGGNGSDAKPLGRTLTPIERMALRVVADRVTGLLQEAWKDHVALQLQLGGFESLPEILLGADRDDSVLVASVEAQIGETTSLLLLCLPFTVLESFFATTRTQRVNLPTEEPAPASRALAEASLRGTRVTVAARFPSIRLSIRDLSSLRVGGVLSTGLDSESRLHVLVNGQQRFEASPGRVGRRLALHILSETRPDPIVTGTHPEEAKP